jgi:radical SAM/Cys-rich protein
MGPSLGCYDESVTAFHELVATLNPEAVHAEGLGVLMLNLGKRCDLACVHCHQDAGPLRTETMTDSVCERAIELACAARPAIVDITGGAPELHPRIRNVVDALVAADLRVRVRTNLVSLLSPPARGVAHLFALRGVDLLASFPSADRAEFDAQRGAGSFDVALEALRMLNALGYGLEVADPGGRRLQLDLAVNPAGVEDAPTPAAARTSLKQQLGALGAAFHDVVVISNVPVGRFGRALEAQGALDPYLERLRSRFNPDVIEILGCRCGVTVSWDGTLADCDFNLGAGITCDESAPQSIFDVDFDERGIAAIAQRRIRYGQHCVACAAGAGSS